MEPALIIIIVLLLILIGLNFFRQPKIDLDTSHLQARIMELQNNLTKIETNLKDDFKANREENANIAKDNRQELNNTLKEFKKEFSESLKTISDQNQTVLEKLTLSLEQKLSLLIEKSEQNFKTNRDSMISSMKDFQDVFDKNVKSFNDLQREKFGHLEESQKKLVDSTEKRLEDIRLTVEEKLQKTLQERIGQSFDLVSKQLENVQKGLGEMQTLAQDVGGLKHVLSNVKMRGSIGEIQLARLLDQVLAPDQYSANVKTKENSNDLVEFAIKLPGKDANNGQVWLPVDAKFPKDIYDQLQTAYDLADATQIELAQKNLENTIKKMAKDIRDKYIDPPNTTDFGIMFLPFEGIYAEVVRKASLLEELHKTYKVIVTGPTTLAAILNSLQMGFKTLAIEKRSSEVWQVLGAVKKEFESFGGLMEKAQNNIRTGLNHLDDVMGKRTRAIQRSLRNVETDSRLESSDILKDLSESANNDDD